MGSLVPPGQLLYCRDFELPDYRKSCGPVKEILSQKLSSLFQFLLLLNREKELFSHIKSSGFGRRHLEKFCG